MNFNDPNQLSSSPFSGDSADETESQAFETADEGSDSTDSDKDLVEDETITNVDDDNNTVNSTRSTSSSGRLEAALQQAAKQAGTQGIGFDEHGDATMEMADEEVTDAFKPWLQEGQSENRVGAASALQDQENINPFSQAGTQGISFDEHGDATMVMADEEVTDAFKPWLQEGQSENRVGAASALQDQENINPFSQAGTQGISFDEHGDATMVMADEEVTDAFKPWLQEGQSENRVGEASALLDQENINPFSPAFKANTARKVPDETDDATMEMTRIVGGILSSGGEAQSRFRNAEALDSAKVTAFEEKVEYSENVAEVAEDDDRIQLQDFLNMTSIRFMELTTTKRRHTMAPTALEQSTRKSPRGDADFDDANTTKELESCVVAGACTAPMLELYQHVSEAPFAIASPLNR